MPAIQDPQPLGAWYDNWGDFTGDVRNIADVISRTTRQTQITAQGVRNATDNASNLFTWRVNGSTVVAGALAVGAILYAYSQRHRTRR